MPLSSLARIGHRLVVLATILVSLTAIRCCAAQESHQSEELPANSFIPSRECKCSMVLFRHLAKTGGTSVAVFFSQLERKIGWRVNQVGNSMQNEELHFDSFVGEFAVDPEAFLEKHPYNLVVFHTKTHHGFNQNIMPLIRYLRKEVEARGCCYSFSTIIREPIAHSVSDYNYEVRGHIYIGYGHQRFENITEYTPQDRSSKELLGFPDGIGTTGALSKNPVNDSMATQLWDLLKNDYTFVGTTEHLEHTMFLMMQQAGLPLEHLHVPHANDGSILKHSSLVSLKSLSRWELDELEKLNEFDFKIYNWAKKRLEASVAAMPEADKTTFKAMSERSTKDWMFGEPEHIDNFMQAYHPYQCKQASKIKIAKINTPQFRFCVTYDIPLGKPFLPPEEDFLWRRTHGKVKARGYGSTHLKSVFETKDLIPCSEFSKNSTAFRCKCPMFIIRYHPDIDHDMHKGCAHLKGWDRRCDECRIHKSDKIVTFEKVQGEDDYNIESELNSADEDK